MPSDESRTLLDAAAAFDALGIRYFVGGSVAAAFLGVIRATVDTDLIADIHPGEVEALHTILEPRFYADREAMIEAVDRRSNFNLIHLETYFKVDVFVPKTRAFAEMQFQRRVTRHLPGWEYPISFASAEDIILAKLEWYRSGREVSDRQWADVLGVLRFRADDLDLPYLRRWAGELGVADLLDRALRESNLKTD